MKKILLIIALLTAFTLSKAEVTRTGNQFQIEQTNKQDTLTPYTWKDSKGNIYPIWISENGKCYIWKVSKKTGKEYKQYLPKEIQEQIRKELEYEYRRIKHSN